MGKVVERKTIGRFDGVRRQGQWVLDSRVASIQ